jgi:antitoxin component YwqK of YwqJK toxin-antitoxin module
MLWCLPAIPLSALIWFDRHPSSAPPSATPAEPVEVPRTQLELQSARLYQIGATNPFSGFMVERYPDGALRSRSAVTNGLLQGLSEGWHTNGQRQVSEQFKNGVSHGARAKWYASGIKCSEAGILDGKLHGLFRRWHEDGTLAEEVEFVAGQPEGASLAYFPNGALKARVVMHAGKITEEKFVSDDTAGAGRRD